MHMPAQCWSIHPLGNTCIPREWGGGGVGDGYHGIVPFLHTRVQTTSVRSPSGLTGAPTMTCWKGTSHFLHLP